MIKWSFVLNNVLNMLSSLHMILASVVVDADMTHLLVLRLVVVSHSFLVVILVIIIFIRVSVVLEPLSKFEDHFLLLFWLVVWIDQHVLVVVGHVKVLVKVFIKLVTNLEMYLFHLNSKLGVEMLQEWHKSVTSPN